VASSLGTNSYLTIINLLKSRNLLDGIGIQGHSLEGAGSIIIKQNLDLLAATGLPIYVS
jgi:endo-1,4-beta-xylanase